MRVDSFRRWIVALFLAAGLLGVASPALACASILNPPRDCCPDGAPAPCKDSGQGGAVLCCGTSASTSSNASVSAPRQLSPADEPSNLPDPALLLVWMLSARTHTNDAPFIEPTAPPRPPDGTSTYLRTARLRL
jgi:hypothetical protein